MVKTKRHWRPRSVALDFAAGEAVSVTVQRFNALDGVSNFKRTGNGFFKMVIRNNVFNEILVHYFHFTETEITTTSKVVDANEFK